MNGQCNPLVLAKFCPKIAAGYKSSTEVLMARIAAQSRLIQEMTKKQVVVFEQTTKRYTGCTNPFQVDDWVYHLLPVAVTNVSRKMQVHWVGPYKVSKIINECQTQVCVDGKLVVVHNGHLLKATGDKPPIVALKDVH